MYGQNGQIQRRKHYRSSSKCYSLLWKNTKPVWLPKCIESLEMLSFLFLEQDQTSLLQETNHRRRDNKWCTCNDAVLFMPPLESFVTVLHELQSFNNMKEVECFANFLIHSLTKTLYELLHGKTYNLDWHHYLMKWSHNFAEKCPK